MLKLKIKIIWNNFKIYFLQTLSSSHGMQLECHWLFHFVNVNIYVVPFQLCAMLERSQLTTSQTHHRSVIGVEQHKPVVIDSEEVRQGANLESDG